MNNNSFLIILINLLTGNSFALDHSLFREELIPKELIPHKDTLKRLQSIPWTEWVKTLNLENEQEMITANHHIISLQKEINSKKIDKVRKKEFQAVYFRSLIFALENGSLLAANLLKNSYYKNEALYPLFNKFCHRNLFDDKPLEEQTGFPFLRLKQRELRENLTKEKLSAIKNSNEALSTEKTRLSTKGVSNTIESPHDSYINDETRLGSDDEHEHIIKDRKK